MVVCGRLVRRALREGEPEEERRRKEILLGPFAWMISAGFCQWYYIYDRDANYLDCYQVGALLLSASFATVVTMSAVTRTLPLRWAEATIVSAAASVLLMDWKVSGEPLSPRMWILNILCCDNLLFIHSTKTAIGLVTVGTLLWLLVSASEDAVRWGLHLEGFATPGSEMRRTRTECADPPCSVGIADGASIFAFSAMFFLLDMWFTSLFANGMRRHAALIEASIEVSERVAMLLAQYDVDGASALIDDDASDRLPPKLRDAYRQLVDNLTTFRPYLPQSCLPGEVAPDGEEVGAADSVSCRSRASMKPGGQAGKRGSMKPKPHATQIHPRTEASPVVKGDSHLDYAGSRRTCGPAVAAAARTSDCSLSRTSRASSMQSTQLASPTPSGCMSPNMGREATGMSKHGQMQSPHRSRKSPAGLGRRHVTLVAANLRGYLALARRTAGKALRAMHAQLLADMMAATAAGRGLTDGISADRFYASVNGARVATGHRLAGVRLAWRFARGTDLAAALATCDGDREHTGAGPAAADGVTPDVALSAAASSGEAQCGDLGCRGLLRYSFVGAVAAWVHAAERLAAAWAAAAAVNGVARRDADAYFLCRLRAAAVYDKPGHHSLAPQELWEIKAARGQQEADEWMYQLERAEASDPWAHANAALKALYAGDHALAEARVSAGRGALAHTDPAMRAELLEAYNDTEAAAKRRPENACLLLTDVHLRAVGTTIASPGQLAPDTDQWATSPSINDILITVESAYSGNPSSHTPGRRHADENPAKPATAIPQQPGQSTLQLRSLTYISKMVPNLTREDTVLIEKTAQRKNQEFNITGILITSEPYFLQTIEGPEDRIYALMDAINRDVRHRSIEIISNSVVPQRLFKMWAMCCVVIRPATRDEMLRVAFELKRRQADQKQGNQLDS